NSGWERYFQEERPGSKNRSYRRLLRISYQRPRDVFSAIKILID
ncbi:hypothetical protein, partial [Enterobacter asburiae]